MVGQSAGLQPVANSEVQKGYGFLLKGVIVGSATSGKTSLLRRFTHDQFSSSYVQTIGIDFEVKSFCSVDGEFVKVQMWDTAGQERFRTITNSYYRGSHGLLLVFDVGDMCSFRSIPDWLNEVESYTLEGTPLILIGNKCDLEGEEREVSKEEAEDFAKEKNLIYIETSAMNDVNVFHAFEIWIEKMIQLQKQRRIDASEKPMTRGLEKKLKQGQSSSKTSSGGQTKSKTCTII